jgi:hypothetical protein
MRHIDTTKPTHTGTETHLGVDEMIDESLDKGSSADGVVDKAYREGFGASSGVRNETAESGGHSNPAPEMKDDSIPDRVPNSLEKENAGLADN